MNRNIDSDILEQSRRTAAVKYLALAICLGLFVAYGVLAA